MPGPDLQILIRQTEQAFAQSQWAQGRELAEQAWVLALAQAEAKSGDADGGDKIQCHVGLLLCQGRYRSGDLTQMLELGLLIAPLVRQQAEHAAHFEFTRMVSLVAAETCRFDVSLAFAQEAHQVAQAGGEVAELALAIDSMACFFERSGDPWQAERLMHEALTLARQQAAARPLFVLLNNLSGVLIGKHYLLRDAMPLDEALEPLQQALPFAREAADLAPTLSDPVYAVFAQGNLAEIGVHLRHDTTAQVRLAAALQQARGLGLHAQVWRLTCSLGEWALSQGQADLARTELQAVLAAASPIQQPIVHLRAHHALWRAAALQGRDKEALQHLQAYMQLERSRSMRQLRAQSELFVTRMEAEQARQDARRQRQRVSQLEADVRLDTLTGLSNRRVYEAAWPSLVEQSRLDATPLSVAMLDLDHFKLVNDQHGHAVGDQVLATLGHLLRTHTRNADLLVRLGGDEFLLAMPDTEAERALEVCERLRLQVAAHPWAELAAGLQVTLSLGLACTPGQPLDGLVAAADAALYRAKGCGRNSLVTAA